MLAALFIAAKFLQASDEPSYQGKTLREWMRGHPTNYIPAIQAMGTNAIPFLLQELQTEDSAPSRAGQEVFRRFLDSAAPWETARTRHYHARLALQILDTNAVPALLNALFQEPFQIKGSHVTWEAANAFNWLVSSDARESVRQALSKALQDPDLQQRRNACLAFSATGLGTVSESRQLIKLTRDSEPTIRAAATRALGLGRSNQVEEIQAFIERLDDPQAAVRRLAADFLGQRKTTAIAAVPALLNAYTNEPTHTNLRDNNVDEIFRGRAISAYEIRWTILQSVKAIAPGTPLPQLTP